MCVHVHVHLAAVAVDDEATPLDARDQHQLPPHVSGQPDKKEQEIQDEKEKKKKNEKAKKGGRRKEKERKETGKKWTLSVGVEHVRT
eukprot:2202021-Rhodomonas_salina.1